MELNTSDILEYAENHSDDEPIILQKLRRETWQKVLVPRMLSGHLQGRLLSLISKMIQPKNILEIGTYTGYSTLCLAEGLAENGTIHTIDKNEELVDFQKKYFKMAKLDHKIIQYTGNALDIIPTINSSYDLVFIDADKINYSNYFDLIINKVRKGGIILSDNVLWSGKVTKKVEKNDRDTQSLIEYNLKLKDDKRVENLLLPVRDGITISRKL
jgi:predicted O-methyltransferase YrrM